MTSKDFRAQARLALKGKWGAAIGVCVVADFLGGGVSIPTNFTGISTGSASTGYLNGILSSQLVASILTIAVVAGLIVLVIGGAVTMGRCSFFTKLIKGEKPRFGELFGCFSPLWRGFCMQFLMGLFTFLWSLLLIIPGILAAYNYAMTPYLMAEFPDLDVMDALRESKRLMHGNRFRLFCLELSFIGWFLLCILTFGIGTLWLSPYQETAVAAFYMDVTGRSEETFRPDPFQPTNPTNPYQGPEF